MSMSNAERQRLFKARRRERLAAAAHGSADDATPAPAVAVTAPALTPPPAAVDIPDPSPEPVAAVAPATLADIAAELGLDTSPAVAVAAVAPIIESVDGNGQAAPATGATSANPAEPAPAPVIIESVEQVVNVGQAQSKGLDDEARGKGRKGKAVTKAKSEDEKAEKVTTEAAQLTTVTREGGTEAPAVVPSPTPARARACNFPEPRQSRKPMCEPCSPSQYVDALAMMRQGATMGEITTITGADWMSLNEHGLTNYPDDWPALAQAWKGARIERLATRAQAVAEQRMPAFQGAVTGPNGRTRTRQRETSPAMLTAAAALIDPATHGRQAGRQAPGVTVNVAMMQPAEAGAVRAETLSTATPLPPRRRTIDV